MHGVHWDDSDCDVHGGGEIADVEGNVGFTGRMALDGAFNLYHRS